MKLNVFFFSLLTLLLTTGAAAAYQLTLDTASWSGLDAIIAYDLIDGSPNSSEVDIDAPLIDGTTFRSASSIEDMFFYNTIEEAVTLGNELVLSFDIGTEGTPVTGFFPDSFSIFLLDSSYLPLFPTTDPTGADSLIQWDIGVGDPTVYAGTLDNSNQNTGPNPVPEPSTTLLFFVGIASIAKISRKRSLSLLLALFFLSNFPTSSYAVSLSPSTELSNQANLDISGLRYNRKTGTFDSIVIIENISQEDIHEPFTLAFPSLPEGVILTNATSISDEGTPFITVDSDDVIHPNEEVEVVLRFVNRTREVFPINFRFIRLEQEISDKEIILGPDADNNGVRDDLEPILDARYPNDSERNAALQVLKNMRNSLATGSRESGFQATIGLFKSFECMYTTIGDDDLAAEEIDYLRDIMMDTRKRVEAWVQSKEKLSGMTLPGEFNNPCELQ
jgi:hypothetical protein